VLHPRGCRQDGHELRRVVDSVWGCPWADQPVLSLQAWHPHRSDSGTWGAGVHWSVWRFSVHGGKHSPGIVGHHQSIPWQGVCL